MSSNLVMIGLGGHATVLLDNLDAQNLQCIGYVDLKESKAAEAAGIRYFGNDERFLSNNNADFQLINGIAGTKNCMAHQKVYEIYTRKGYQFTNVIHPSAILSHSAQISTGTQINARAVVQPDVDTAENVIINTGAIIEHNVHIGKHCHIAPGAVICGFCQIGDSVFIGANTTVLPGLSICANVVIGAGAVITKNITESGIYLGNPASLALKEISA